MSQSLSSELVRLVIDVVIFWFLGLLLGYPLWGVIFGFVVFIAMFARRYHKFEKWINQGLSEPEDLGGIFEDLSFRIYRFRSQNKKRKKKLTELLRRWQDSSSALPDAAVVIDGRGIIDWFNVTASSMLGLKPSDQGRHISNLIRNPRFIHYLAKNDFTEHLEIASPIDITKILSIRVTPYGAGQRLLLVSDVTHIQRLMTMRRDFIANVSHELRTPLTVILGYLETLSEDEEADADALRNYMDKVEAPANRMKSLVEDLLLLSKLDTGAPSTPATSSVINVAAIIKNIETEAKQLSKDKHQFVFDVDHDLQLKGVEKEIYSAFINLVTNAIRYTPEGGEIKVSWQVQGDQANFCVKDTGAGIAPEHMPRLTERFYRIDIGRSRSSGGTGLGLAIVKQVLRRHDAELNIDSEYGKGSEFCCTFPQARVVFNKNGQAVEKNQIAS